MRSRTLLLLLCVAAALTGCSAREKAPAAAPVDGRMTIPAVQRMSQAYGVVDFHSVYELHFTFNVRLGERHVVRAWVWRPGQDEVEYAGAGPDGNEVRIRYRRAQVASMAGGELLRQIDHWFINDSYWLLFPFHVAWDQAATVRDEGDAPLPLGAGTARRIVVSYPAEGGYTPGDVYELFIGDDGLIRQWLYRPRGSIETARAATWENHRQLGPIVLSLRHENREGGFVLWFTDVAARIAGRPLIKPKPGPFTPDPQAQNRP